LSLLPVDARRRNDFVDLPSGKIFVQQTNDYKKLIAFSFQDAPFFNRA